MLLLASWMAACVVWNLLGVVPEVLPIAAYLACSLAAGILLVAVAGHRGAAQTSVVLVSCCITLVAADLTWRAAGAATLYYRPEEMFVNRWPRMASLSRFTPNASYHAYTYGDLAAMSARPELREYRTIRFRSDAFGFPNAAVREPAGVILLGDSFGAGSGTDQAKTWASLLETRYGHRVYNLSMPDHSPWQELMNLRIELPRLRRQEGAVLLWALFSGNDLDDRFEDQWEPRLTTSLTERWRVAAATFRNRSPVRQLCRRAYLIWSGGHRPPIPRQLPSGRTILFRAGYAERARRTGADMESHQNLPRLVRAFEEMRRFAERERLRVAVAALPSKEEVYGWVLEGRSHTPADAGPSAFSSAIRQLCETNGFAFSDLKPHMVRSAVELLAEENKLLWWSDDTHWNEAGHALAAAVVHRELLTPVQAVRMAP